MNTRMVNTAADVISRAMQKGRTLPAALAVALDSAQLLQSPETAAETERLRLENRTLRAAQPGNARLYDTAVALERERNELRAQLAELKGGTEQSAPTAPQGQQARTILDRARDALGARMTRDDLRHVLGNVIAYTAELEARLAEHEQSPLAWARLLDAKSLDNFLTALSMAADTDPQDGALAQVEEMIRSFRAALPHGAQERRARTLHDHIVARDAEIERLRARLAEYERPADEDPIAYALTDQADGITRQIAPVQALREDSQNGGAC